MPSARGSSGCSPNDSGEQHEIAFVVRERFARDVELVRRHHAARWRPAGARRGGDAATRRTSHPCRRRSGGTDMGALLFNGESQTQSGALFDAGDRLLSPARSASGDAPPWRTVRKMPAGSAPVTLTSPMEPSVRTVKTRSTHPSVLRRAARLRGRCGFDGPREQERAGRAHDVVIRARTARAFWAATMSRSRAAVPDSARRRSPSPRSSSDARRRSPAG